MVPTSLMTSSAGMHVHVYSSKEMKKIVMGVDKKKIWLERCEERALMTAEVEKLPG